jgi:alpha-galactosidase
MPGDQPGVIVATTCGDRPAWLLQTAHSSMLLSVTGEGSLLLDHWGGANPVHGENYLPPTPANRRSQQHFLDGVPQAYTFYGEPAFKEPCMCVVYADGSRIVRLTLTGDRITERDGTPALVLTLTDPRYGLVVEHHLVVHGDLDVIARHVRLENGGQRALDVERAASAALGLPPGQYEAWTLHGRWGAEFQVERRALLPGKFVTDSRRGFTSNEANPWFAVARQGDAKQVWFGALAWSGNWSMVFETERNGAHHLVAGINPFDFTWRLEPGEEFTTPTLACGYTEGGLGEASRVLHRYQVAKVLPENHRDLPRPVHFNSWFSTYFDVVADHQIELARRAADLGFELFVIDDGWFGRRDSDRAGLGDWVANPTKFPRGLSEVIDEVHRLGMQFGIWVEPEMVNPDSDLYRTHPEWILHFPGREPTLARNQLVLNMAREDTRAHVRDQLQRLLRDHDIDFLKIDHNRPYTEAGWPDAPLERQREVWVRHVHGVYELIDQLRREFPHLIVETCAGGGGRVDLGILALTDQAWVSDNTDPSDRLFSQRGYSLAYPARTMVNWVTDNPDPTTGRITPLAFRFHVAMQGVLGVSADIARWTDDECREAAELIADYKRFRPTIQQGDQYWLVAPTGSGPCAVQYVSAEPRESVVFVYQVSAVAGRAGTQLRLQGLDPRRRYRRTSDGLECAGATLMSAGLPIVFAPRSSLSPDTGDWQSVVDHWRAIDHE